MKLNTGSFRVNSEKDLIFDNQKKIRSLWTVSDVAMFLNVSKRTVQDWVYRKIIPFRKAGRTVRFAPFEIEQWTLQNR